MWLTFAVALFLPALAWIEARADLPAQRLVALAVAALILVRLVLNWARAGLRVRRDTGRQRSDRRAYAAPAVAFWVRGAPVPATRRRSAGRDIEAGADTFATFFVALEIRHGFNGGEIADAFGFNEVALHSLTLSVQATMYALFSRWRTGRPILDWAWRGALGCGAMAIAVALVVFNPALTDDNVGVTGAARGVSALFRRRWRCWRGGSWAVQGIGQLLGAHALVGCFAWIMLQIRQLFHPEHMSVITGEIEDAELWAWSGAWLAYGIALMGIGHSRRISGRFG